MKKKTPQSGRRPYQHAPKVEFSITGTHTAEAWSYIDRASRQVYVQVADGGRAITLVAVRVPRA